MSIHFMEVTMNRVSNLISLVGCGATLIVKNARPRISSDNQRAWEPLLLNSRDAKEGDKIDKLGLLKRVSIIFVVCADTAVGSLAQSFSTLFSFNSSDGANPKAGLVQGADGNFYGTTATGGSNGAGTVFKMTPTGVLTTLHNFNSTNGIAPYAGLVQGADGNFYGTTGAGGTTTSSE